MIEESIISIFRMGFEVKQRLMSDETLIYSGIRRMLLPERQTSAKGTISPGRKGMLGETLFPERFSPRDSADQQSGRDVTKAVIHKFNSSQALSSLEPPTKCERIKAKAKPHSKLG